MASFLLQRMQSSGEPSDSDFDVDIETLSEDTADSESIPSRSSSPRKAGESPRRMRKIKKPRKGKRRSGRLCTERNSQDAMTECCLCFEIDDVDSMEEMIKCSECGNSSHQTCLKISNEVLSIVKEYPWQCSSCKTCENCYLRRPKSKLRACSNCDRGYHRFCVEPRFDEYDRETWKCQFCQETAAPNTPHQETVQISTKSEKVEQNSEDQTALTLRSPARKTPTKRKKSWNFGQVKRSRYKAEATDSDTNPTSTESEDSDNGSAVDGSLSSSPAKGSGFKSKKKCPIAGCDGLGHFTGKFDLHHTISGCPKYHNMTAEECKSKAEDKEKESQEKQPRISKRTTTSSLLSSDETPRRDLRRQVALSLMPEKIRSAVRGGDIASATVDRYKPTRLPSSSFVPIKDDPTSAEPPKIPREELKEELLTGLTSDSDLNLFKSAWKKAAQINEEEQSVPVNGRPVCRCIVFGMYEIDTWYSSPYPEEYQRLKKIYICEFCLKYMKSPTILRRHMAKCVWKHPPGLEIYRKNNLSVFEVDGKKHKTYCQNLCLMAKLFLDHKTLYYDVEPFLFYVMTKADNVGCRFIGYFSKEKKSFLNYNVSCILSLPAYMKQGYGKMLIDFSYLLSTVEGKVGSPEKPLSDLGLISYRSYWKSVVLKYLQSYGYDKISVRDISQETAIHPNDIVSTLQYLGILKYWKGKHVVLRSKELIDEYSQKVASRPSNYQEIDPACLRWIPPIIADIKS
ncbi:hypothetical protein QZH41_009599 [Actinostola sp. cb2023]|nr:hypothetical protein QZH41_009599 [Actinostola sp. cb2023]